MKVHLWTEYGDAEVFVTGTQDVDEARRGLRSELLERIRDGYLYDARVGELGLDDEAWADAVVASATAWRLEAGRIVPIYSDDYSWTWMEGLKLDRPGAIFALRAPVNLRADVPGFACPHQFIDGYPGAHSRRCVHCLEPDMTSPSAVPTKGDPNA